MDRRLSGSADQVRFRVDPTRCDGQGVCALIAPELFGLDRYGDAFVLAGAEEAALDPEVRARGLEADAMCPRNAISEIAPAVARAEPPTVAAPERPESAPPPRLLGDTVEGVAAWRERGGFTFPADLLETVERCGLTGHGGAAFPTASKWRRVAGSERAVVVVNGSEREPGTHKDRYLLANRPGLVLDGALLAMRAVGAAEAIIAVDEDAVDEHDAVATALADAAGLGLLEGMEIRTQKVPTRYVAGEETALLSLIDGGPGVPRQRPPYPSQSGVGGRPTLVQNVETLAQVALLAALGLAEFTAVGAADAPGTGLFSVGRFGAQMSVLERPMGYPLPALLAEAGLAGDVRAVLVGGYAGGLLPPQALDLPLAPAALSAAGAALGTKSIQVIGTDQCPVAVTADIVSYFAGESAEQCPPCSRGLPDMAALLRSLEDGTGDSATVADLAEFMGTLADRGICRLPDGAARVALSLLARFPDEVTAHAAGGCPR